MNFETVLYAVDQGIARLTLNRPDKLNSFTGEMHQALAGDDPARETLTLETHLTHDLGMCWVPRHCRGSHRGIPVDEGRKRHGSISLNGPQPGIRESRRAVSVNKNDQTVTVFRQAGFLFAVGSGKARRRRSYGHYGATGGRDRR